MSTSFSFAFRILSLIIMLTPVSSDPPSQGVDSCFSDLCRSGFYCDNMEERCSPCSVALCRLKYLPKDCQRFCFGLNKMMTTNAKLTEYVSTDTSLTEVQLIRLTIIAATIMVMLVVNVVSNLVNMRFLLVMKQAYGYGVKPDIKPTAPRKKQMNKVNGVSAPALTSTKPFLSIHQPRSVPIHVTNTVPSLPVEDGSLALRYDFDVCRQSNSGDCETGCDNDSPASSPPLCRCDSQITDTSSEVPTISRNLSLSQRLQQTFSLDEETSLKMITARASSD